MGIREKLTIAALVLATSCAGKSSGQYWERADLTGTEQGNVKAIFQSTADYGLIERDEDNKVYMVTAWRGENAYGVKDITAMFGPNVQKLGVSSDTKLYGTIEDAMHSSEWSEMQRYLGQLRNEPGGPSWRSALVEINTETLDFTAIYDGSKKRVFDLTGNGTVKPLFEVEGK